MSGFASSHGVDPVTVPHLSREITTKDITVIWQLFRIFRDFGPDVIHTHTAKAGTAGRLAGLLYTLSSPRRLIQGNRCRFVHTFHGHVFHGYYGAIKTSLFLLIERTLALLTDRIIVLSDQQLAEISERFEVGRREKFAVVPLGIELSDFDDSGTRRDRSRKALGLTSETAIGIVGRLVPIKNHDLFIDAAARLVHEQQIRNLRFFVFGDGDQRSRLGEQVKRAQLSRDLVFCGTATPADIYPSLDLVVLTSNNEGTPLAIIEAMASRRPVVSTSVGGVVDVLGEVVARESNTEGAEYEVRERGLTVQAGDAAGLAAAIVRVLSDDALRERIVTAGHEFVTQRYSKDRLVADIIALYRSICTVGKAQRRATASLEE